MSRDPFPRLLGLLSFALYLPAIGWGLPYATHSLIRHGWDVDSVAGMPLLAEFHNLLVEAKPDWSLNNPLFHYLVLGAWCAPYVAYLYLSGGLSNPSGDYPYGFADPVGSIATLAFLGRLLTLLMACAAIVVTYRVGREVWDRSTGLFAALALALSTFMVFYSRTGNLDIPVLFWTSLGMLVLARSLREGLSSRRAVWLGVLAAVAMATKDQAVVVWCPLLVALAFVHYREARSPTPIVMLGVAGLCAYVLASGLLLWPSRFARHISFLLNFENPPYWLKTWNFRQPPTLDGYLALLAEAGHALWEGIGVVVLLAALVGAWATWRSSRFSRLLVLMVLSNLLFLLFLARLMYFRYLVFVYLALALLAARAFVLGLRGSRTAKAVALVALVVGFGWQGLTAVELTYQMLFDARYESSRWLSQRCRTGDEVAYFGDASQLPRLPPGVLPRHVVAGDNTVELIAQRPFHFILVIPDWSSRSGLEHSRALPESLYNALRQGSLGYQRVAIFRGGSLLGQRFRNLPHVNPSVQVFAPIRPQPEAGFYGADSKGVPLGLAGLP